MPSALMPTTKQDSNVEILRNLKTPAPNASPAIASSAAPRKTPARTKHHLVRVIRNNVFLDEQLHRVRNGLQQSVGRAHRPQPRLHVCQSTCARSAQYIRRFNGKTATITTPQSSGAQ